MLDSDIWGYGHLTATQDPEVTEDEMRSVSDCTGYGVEALDGSIGKVDEATYEVGGGRIVVDTGPWIFGKKVTLPAGVIDRIDHEEEKVHVHRTKDEIKGAPELDASIGNDEQYRRDLGAYYGPDGAGYREFERARPF